jgi:hypothetical protein
MQLKKEAEEDLSKLERFKVLLNTWLVMDNRCVSSPSLQDIEFIAYFIL